MSPAQINKYRAEWGHVRRVLRKTLDPKQADSRRHELHKKALGYDKSSEDLTNAEFDEILKVFWAISRPADLDAQLRQIDQPVFRKGNLLKCCRKLAERCVDKLGLEDFYLNGMARKIFGEAHGYRMLNEVQLARLKGILEQRHRQMDKAEGRSTPHATGRNDNPF